MDYLNKFLPLMEEDGGGGGGEPPKEPPADPPKEKTYTEDEMNAKIDEIVGAKFSKWKKSEEAKLEEAKKLAEMNAEEKAKYEKEQLESRLKEYESKESLAEMTKQSRAMLKEKGITADDGLLSALVSDDAESTKKAVDEFAEMFNTAVEERVKAELKGDTPKTGKAKNITKEEIMAVKDTLKRRKLIAQHKELFE